MDITTDKIDSEALKLAEVSANKPFAFMRPRAEEDCEKISESETREPLNNQFSKELTEKLQRYVDSMNIDIAFTIYGKNKKNISIVVSEKETGKLIREIPPEELQKLHVKMEELAGMFFNGMF